MKKMLCIVFAVSILISSLQNSKVALADSDGNTCEVGIAAVGNYSYWDDLNNINASTKIGDSIYKAFNGNAKKWKIGFRSYDAMVTVDKFKGKSLGGYDHLYADNVDLLFYVGIS